MLHSPKRNTGTLSTQLAKEIPNPKTAVLRLYYGQSSVLLQLNGSDLKTLPGRIYHI